MSRDRVSRRRMAGLSIGVPRSFIMVKPLVAMSAWLSAMYCMVLDKVHACILSMAVHSSNGRARMIAFQ